MPDEPASDGTSFTPRHGREHNLDRVPITWQIDKREIAQKASTAGKRVPAKLLLYLYTFILPLHNGSALPRHGRGVGSNPAGRTSIFGEFVIVGCLRIEVCLFINNIHKKTQFKGSHMKKFSELLEKTKPVKPRGRVRQETVYHYEEYSEPHAKAGLDPWIKISTHSSSAEAAKKGPRKAASMRKANNDKSSWNFTDPGRSGPPKTPYGEVM